MHRAVCWTTTWVKMQEHETLTEHERWYHELFLPFTPENQKSLSPVKRTDMCPAESLWGVSQNPVHMFWFSVKSRHVEECDPRDNTPEPSSQINRGMNLFVFLQLLPNLTYKSRLKRDKLVIPWITLHVCMRGCTRGVLNSWPSPLCQSEPVWPAWDDWILENGPTRILPF